MFRLAADPKHWISVTAPLSACPAFSPGLIEQEARDCTVHDLLHRRHRLWLSAAGAGAAGGDAWKLPSGQ